MTAPTRSPALFTTALVLFAVGLLAVVAIFALAAGGVQAPWLWMVTMCLPLGLVLGVWHVVRGRR